MTFTVSDKVRAKCQEFEVDIHPDARFGHSGARSFAVEAPALIRPGIFDFDLLGGFSYLGDHDPSQGTLLRHVNVIGRFCSIAGRLSVSPDNSPSDWLSTHPLFRGAHGWGSVTAWQERNSSIFDNTAVQCPHENLAVQIGNDVWIGEGVCIHRGVSIGDGAVIASHAVVTEDVPPYAVVAGVPARVLKYRFAPDVVEELLNMQWWHYGMTALDGVDFTRADFALWKMAQNIESGRAQPYQAPVLEIGPDDVTVYHLDPETGALAA